jgi:hypothetical protein
MAPAGSAHPHHPPRIYGPCLVAQEKHDQSPTSLKLTLPPENFTPLKVTMPPENLAPSKLITPSGNAGRGIRRTR